MDTLAKAIATEESKSRQLVARITSAAVHSDADTFIRAISELADAYGDLRPAMLRLARIDARPTPDFSLAIQRVFADFGDDLRRRVGDDLLLIRVLRALQQPYYGPELQLYRGDSFDNRQRRTYGYSWTLDEQVAQRFARSELRSFRGGAVVIASLAPPESIIAIRKAGRFDDEQEVWVDRRHLKRVQVLTRLPIREQG